MIVLMILPADTLTIIIIVVCVVVALILVIPAIILRCYCRRIRAANRAEARAWDDAQRHLRQQRDSRSRTANGSRAANGSTAANSSTTRAPVCIVALSINPNHVEPKDPTLTEAPPPAYNVAVEYPIVEDNSLPIRPPPPPSYHESPSDLQPPPPPYHHESNPPDVSSSLATPTSLSNDNSIS